MVLATLEDHLADMVVSRECLAIVESLCRATADRIPNCDSWSQRMGDWRAEQDLLTQSTPAKRRSGVLPQRRGARAGFARESEQSTDRLCQGPAPPDTLPTS